MDMLIATFGISKDLLVLYTAKDFQPFQQHLGLKNGLSVH